MFNLEGIRRQAERQIARGYSSAGRAPALQAGGRRFDPDYLHQENTLSLIHISRFCVPSYAPRWVTGGAPVGPYLACAVRSALKSPFTGRSPPRSHHPGLSEGIAAPTTSLSHRFVLCTCCGVLYASGTHLSSPGRKFFWQPPAGHGIMGTLSEERQEWI